MNRNIKLCKLYKFVKGSKLYFKCILTLMKKQKTSGLVVFLLKSLIPCLIPKIYEVKKPLTYFLLVFLNTNGF